ncbi:uncharacterized protein LOC143027468 [Oratosquilla oratoria]|uniref:uncharacterized protein LOC143027468 n=1 Tax=Oratosquilla oratoria TaxID=337810 RepID=UPI003F761566
MLTSGIIAFLLMAVLPSCWSDICDRRDKRFERGLWKGDIGDILPDTESMARDRLRLHHRRKRFLSFPTGSVLTVTPKLTIPWYSEGDVSSDKLFAFPLELNLPNATLRFAKPMSSSMYGSYSKFSDSPYNIFGSTEDPILSTYSSYTSYKKRSLDYQRLSGFELMQKTMDSVGMNGRSCVLRAVCGMANQSLDDLGLIGEMIKLFFSAGYGEGSDEVADYVEAEELGRLHGGCDEKYPSCPMDFMGILQDFVSSLRHGMTSINMATGTNSL